MLPMHQSLPEMATRVGCGASDAPRSRTPPVAQVGDSASPGALHPTRHLGGAPEASHSGEMAASLTLACHDGAMHIGLIGGIGPAATVAYYVGRVRAAGGRLEMTIVQADLDELIANGRADDRPAQARAYAKLIDQLRGAGAECAAITSLGGHFCLRETEPLASLPIVSGTAPVDTHLVASGYHRVGILGTEIVMRSLLFGQLVRTEAVAPAGDLAALGRTYQDVAVAGACTDEQRAELFEAGRRMVEDRGAEAIVLAGTDLGLAFDGRDPGYPVVDALDTHVALLADLALGRATLPA